VKEIEVVGQRTEEHPTRTLPKPPWPPCSRGRRQEEGRPGSRTRGEGDVHVHVRIDLRRPSETTRGRRRQAAMTAALYEDSPS